MDYSTLALLTFQLKKQDLGGKKEELEQQIKDLVSKASELGEEALYDVYANNATFASKMSEMVQEAASKLYTMGVLEKDTALMQHFVGRSFTMLTDAVIWEEIAQEFSDLLGEAEEMAE